MIVCILIGHWQGNVVIDVVSSVTKIIEQVLLLNFGAFIRFYRQCFDSNECK